MSRKSYQPETIIHVDENIQPEAPAEPATESLEVQIYNLKAEKAAALQEVNRLNKLIQGLHGPIKEVIRNYFSL
jgi:hypothetical protein